MSVEPQPPRAGLLTRLVARSPEALTHRLWVWPLLGAAVIALAGLWVRSRLEQEMKSELSTHLETVLKADVAALQMWFSEQEADAKSFAADVRIREAILQLAALAQDPSNSPSILADAPAAETLQRYLVPLLANQEYVDYVVVGADKRILASPHRRLVGRSAPPAYDLFLRSALSNHLAISRPFARELSVDPQAEGPTMFVAAPVVETNDEVVAALGLRMRPEEQFSRIFSVARMGFTGEAYAFDRTGLMLTASRFNAELKQLGLIPDSPEATAILNLQLIDPGARFQKPGVSPRRLDNLPLTRMAADAVQGQRGVDVDGYRNYRGMEVIGAWAWLPKYEMGVATEVATDEAFQPLYVVRRMFVGMFALLVLSSIAMFVITVFFERLRASARMDAMAARRLGQYVLVDEIGRGASGIVYRARHSLLRRPVAVKLLNPELTNDSTAARFEHEVQMTSHLTHPNTVAIYDYGRTPEGLFYYAMEFLSGIDLDRLVRQFGPQSEGRVIHILRQVCGSLAEAHATGLIHRDIKPANILLTRRGGSCDVAKVLDFGVVKTVQRSPGDTTPRGTVFGTPRFMAPEAIAKPDEVDARSDLYSLGAVGYWLLTGQPLFDTDNVDALLDLQLKIDPVPPSVRLGRAVSPDLEALLLSCLAKDRLQRPSGAKVLEEALARCVASSAWTSVEAEKWWLEKVGPADLVPPSRMPEKTLAIFPRE